MKSGKKPSKGRRTSGGQAGMRGYLVQTLIALLDVLLDKAHIDTVTLEPDHASEQFDILWKDENGLHAVQVKSTESQFSPSDTKKWAATLETSGRADDYRLCLVGLHSSSIASTRRIGRVHLDLKNLDLSGFREQAAHRMDRFLSSHEMDAGSAEYREMLADSLTARLAAYSTTGKSFCHSDVVNLLKTWINEGPKPSLEIVSTRLADAARERLGEQLSHSHISLKYDPAYYVPRELEGDIEKWLAVPRSRTRSCCFLILASAGSGKTNLLSQVARRSSVARPTFFTTGAQLRFDEELGIWGCLFDVITRITKVEARRNSVTSFVAKLTSESPSGLAIVFDAINEFHDPARLRRELNDFLSEAENAGVSVLISCRDYYWGLFEAPWWKTFLKVSSDVDDQRNTKRLLHNFTSEEAAGAFSVYFRNFQIAVQPEGNAREQLRHPLLLRFFCETHRGKQIGPLRDVRLKDLFDRYWDTKLDSIAERMIDQGEWGIQSEIARHVGQGILGVAGHMLQKNARAIPSSEAIQLTHSSDAISRLRTPYGRILDEHIILEEFTAQNPDGETHVAFVFEEFMEYAMAKSLLQQWQTLQPAEIGNRVVSLTTQYGNFSQVFGVVLYVALMLKENRGIGLWPVLIGLGPTWETAVIEAFRKLPPDQIDDGVFQAIIDLLSVPNKEVQAEALELLKFGRLKDIVLDPVTTRIQYVAVTYGGFLGLGDKLFAVPIQAIRVQQDPDHQGHVMLVMDVTKEQMNGANGFDESNWPNFSDPNFAGELHRRYKTEDHWNSGANHGGKVDVKVARDGVKVIVDKK